MPNGSTLSIVNRSTLSAAIKAGEDALRELRPGLERELDRLRAGQNAVADAERDGLSCKGADASWSP